MNADGYADIATRVHGNDDSWVVILYGNPSARLLFHAQGPFRPFYIGTSYGFEMVGGDFNSDGYSDVIIAGWGFADVFHGSESGLSVMTRLVKPRWTSVVKLDGGPRNGFAGSISAPGDLDGDGHADLVIGAVGAPIRRDPTAIGRGQAFVYHTTGMRFPELWSEVLEPTADSHVFGVSAIPGDLNGDGLDDLLIGAPGGFFPSSYVYVYLGRSGDWWCPPTQVMQMGPYAALGSGFD